MNKNQLKAWLIGGGAVLLIALLGLTIGLGGFLEKPSAGDEAASSESKVESGKKPSGGQESNAADESGEQDRNDSKGADGTINGSQEQSSGNQSGNPPQSNEGANTSGEDQPISSGDSDSGNKGEDQEQGNSSEEEPGKEDTAEDDASADPRPEEDKAPYIPEPMSYEEYIALSAAEQQAYFKRFERYEDYFTWYSKAKAEYEKKNPSVEIDDGAVNIGDLTHGK